ncbi:MAG: DUF1016 domain-containing protein [Deltaproteobacteria bacterium]|nr:DUF1016 domain-containing protein [Deltaproteobacteria bacterium]
MNRFSVANLWNFRQFYQTFPATEKINTLCRELSWSHIRLIMRLESHEAREYYLKESKESNWSVRTLQRNINSKYYERLLSSPSAKTESNNITVNPKQKLRNFVKDPYVLEFLELPEDKSLKE